MRPAKVTRPSVAAAVCLLLALAVTVSAPSAAQEKTRGLAADAASAAPRLLPDVRYGSADGQQKMDVFTPVGWPGKRPGALLIHGGGWYFGDKDFYTPIGRRLAELGYVAFALDYRLAPASPWPAQLDDVQRAVRWIRAHADRYNLDPQRLAALGESAGGHLSVFLGARETRDNSDRELAAYSSRVQCVVDFYGPTDLAAAWADPQGDTGKFARETLTKLIGKPLSEAPAPYRDASPLFWVDAHSAPMLIITGTDDPLVVPAQSTRLYDALRAAKVEASLALMYKQGHAFLNPKDPQTYGAMTEEFLARHLKP